jgi:hypothetical protein
MFYYLATRFSVFDPQFNGFKITNLRKAITPEEIETLRDTLFSDERLEFKFKVFEKVTLPSIVNQTFKNFIWLIYTSKYLPEKFKDRLENLVKPFSMIKVKYVDTMMEAFSDIDREISHPEYATIRLDDDDGLCPTFIEWLDEHKTKEEIVVSFPYGTNFELRDDEIYEGSEVNFPKNSMGLALFNSNIYLNGGRHTKIDEKFPVIYDTRKKAYLSCCSIFCDTGRIFK